MHSFLPGNQLIKMIDDLYIAYSDWRAHYPQNFHCLTLIKHLAEVSISGGKFLTNKEEDKLVSELAQLKEALFFGNLKHSQIPEQIDQMLSTLTNANAKAKLVVQITKMQCTLNLRSENEQDQAIKKLMDRIICNITPDLPEIHAIAISKELSMALSPPKKGDSHFLRLEEKITGWLL